MTSPPKRHGRLGGPKTTTGCKTCKARKIKCDEAKPECLRCTKTGRKCLGYEPWQVVSSDWYPGQVSSQGSYRRSPSMSPGTVEESMHYQYFIEHASRCIAGVLDTDFWSRLIPQISQTVPAVRHCIVAISSLFRLRYHAFPGVSEQLQPISTELLQPNLSEERDAAIGVALKYYNKAIKDTMMGMKQDQKEVLTAVVTCILFFCIESLQGKSNEAVSLYHGGQNMIDNLKKEPATDSYDSLSIIRGDIMPVFSRLRVLAALHGSPREAKSQMMAHHPEARDITYSYVTIDEARADLFDLTADIHYYIANSFEDKWKGDVELLEMSRTALLTELQTWRRRASGLLQLSSMTEPSKSNNSKQKATRSDIARLILSCHYLIIHIWLECTLQLNECCYDEHLDTFEKIVDLSEKVLDIRRQTLPNQQTYTFEMELIPPLFMTARKCRHPQLRRQAVNLLRQGSVQEGLWNAKHSIDVAARCINLEEKELSGKTNSLGWPHEDERLHETMIMARTMREDGKFGSLARFFRRQDEQWQVWEEWFDAPLNEAFGVRSPG